MKSFVFLIIAFLWSQPAAAHSLRTFAYFDNDNVFTETYFNDGKAAKNAHVEVYEGTGNTLLLTGTTDDKGEFSFKTPEAESLKIVVRASMGHQSETILEKQQTEEKDRSNDKDSAQENMSDFSPSHTQVSLTKEEIEKIIESQLDKKLAPLHALLRQIARQGSEPSINEIIGGIGYIMGIFGIIAFYYSKKTNHKSNSRKS